MEKNYLFMILVILFLVCGLVLSSPSDNPQFYETYAPVENPKCFSTISAMFIRGMKSNGLIDEIGVKSVKALTDVGVRVHPYIVPSPKAGVEPDLLAQHFYKAFKELYPEHGTAIKIQHPALWQESSTENRAFLEKLLTSLEKHCQTDLIAIWTSKNTWEKVMGKDYSGQQNRFLWDIKIDGDPHYKNFIPYGGWYSPYFKQYQLNVEKCNQKSLSISSFKPGRTWFKH